MKPFDLEKAKAGAKVCTKRDQECLHKKAMIRVFTAFSGYDSQCLALDRIGVDYDLVGWSEIDRYAIKAHDALFPQYAGRNYGDISRIDWANVPDFDLFTYSFPCTDISAAGQQKGFTEGSGTRSSLLWECRKAVETKRPRFLLMENVKALTSEKFMPLFREWEMWLRGQGYTNYSAVLNAKDYGVPQNRERIFMVSILGGGWFEFPHKEPLHKRLKDVLESNVEERYYLSDKIVQGYLRHNAIHSERGNGFTFEPTDGNCIAHALVTSGGGRATDNYIIDYGDRE